MKSYLKLAASVAILIALSGCDKSHQGPQRPVSIAYVPTEQKLDPKCGAADPNKSFVYYDIKLLGVEGRGWPESECENYYDRLPAKAKGRVSKANWDLSKDSSGMCTTFITDSNAIAVRYKLRSDMLGMSHMPPTGVSGIDLYINDNGRWHLLGVDRRRIAYPICNLIPAKNIIPGTHLYRIYLPLYNGVDYVEIGIKPGAFIAKATPRPAGKARPIVFYGTSILQGGCASRPGMVYTSILGRWLDYPTINLGFSGSALMEPQIADLMAEIDASAYVLDALPNMLPPMVKERYEPFVLTLRKAHPDTPIIMVESMDYQAMEYIPPFKQIVTGDNENMKQAYKNLCAQGVRGLYYVPRGVLMGNDGEAVVDGVHATDLGFMRMAEGLYPILCNALKQKKCH